MHKGITEEIAKKCSCQVVKHQHDIVGADLTAIAAKHNQTTAVHTQQRMAAIQTAKTEKKDKETKKVGGCHDHAQPLPRPSQYSDPSLATPKLIAVPQLNPGHYVNLWPSTFSYRLLAMCPV